MNMKETLSLPPDVQVAMALGSKYYAAEPLFAPLNVSIPLNAALNNQDFDLNLDYDIYVYAIAMSSTGAFSFMLRDSGASVQYMTAQLNNTTIVAPTGIGPVFPLYRPWKIPMRNNLIADFTNLTGATNAVQLVLCAWKSRPQAGDQ